MYYPLLSSFLTLSFLSTAALAEEAKPVVPPEKTATPLVTITEAWVREVPPGVKMSAAYMTVTNSTDHDLTLVSASSPEFGQVELHSTVVEEGVAKMKLQPQIPIAAQQSVVFKPGGFHFMLLDAQKEIVAGNKINLTLNFKEGQQTVAAEIKSASSQTPPEK